MLTRAVALSSVVLAAIASVSSATADARPQGASEHRVRLEPADRASPALELHVYRPAGPDRAAAAIVALHGCGGLLDRNGSIGARERAFAAHFTALGYAVVMPDSFNPRGVREVCTIAPGDRPVTVAARRDDLVRVIRWVAQAPAGLDGRYALVGWSNGASTLLHSLDAARWPSTLPVPAASFAFYPGCSGATARIAAVVGPLTMFIAADDNWTLPEPCVGLANRLRGASSRVALRVFEGAVHGFDSPSSPLRVRRDVPLRRNGVPVQVRVGSHPQARRIAYDQVRETLANRFDVDPAAANAVR